MKTLILNGSPRKQGDTSSLLDMIMPLIHGEYMLINAYEAEISPCIDCRYCWKNNGCAINDQMQMVYDYIKECDNILIASPIYFSELTGKLLDVASRLQTFYCARSFRHEECISKTKKGAVLLVGGGDGSMDKAYDTACTILHHMNCYSIHELVACHNMNNIAAIEDEHVVHGIQDILNFFDT